MAYFKLYSRASFLLFFTNDIVDIIMYMAQLVVRNLEDNVKARLRRRAQRHGRSMEEEVRDILRGAAAAEEVAALALGTRLSKRFAGIGLDAEVEELRGNRPLAALFKR